MNIFIREMRANRKSLILWCVGMLFMVTSGMGKYAAYNGDGAQNMNKLMEQMPKSLQTIFGIGSLDLTKISGYYGLLFLYFLLMAAVHAVMLGANIISKEERDKTTEFLFVKPVSRNTVINAKLLAAGVNIIILNIVTLVSSIVVVGKYSKGENITGDIVMFMLCMFIFQLLFLSIGTGLATITKNPKSSTGIATAIVLFTYILSVVSDLNGNLEGLKYLTPFKYFDAANLLNRGGADPVFVSISILIIAALTRITYVFFNKRDLNI